jgi:ribosomal protein S18 acetylase RimI-like enzyme
MRSGEEVVFRPARKAESRAIAELYQISSDGVADYIWTGLAEPGENILDVGARRYARENTDFSYQNVAVATIGDKIVGMIAAYTMGPPGQPGTEFDFDVDPVLRPFQVLEQPNSYYVSGVALFPEYRGSGIGGRFMQRAFDVARSRGLPHVSLIVFEQNVGAKRLYDRLGFREAMRESVIPHPLIHYTGDALLLVKEI